MEIRIGVTESQKEIILELDEKPEDLTKRVESSLTDGSSMIWFDDQRGRRVGVATKKLAYIEIEANPAPRSVGFGP